MVHNNNQDIVLPDSRHIQQIIAKSQYEETAHLIIILQLVFCNMKMNLL